MTSTDRITRNGWTVTTRCSKCPRFVGTYANGTIQNHVHRIFGKHSPTRCPGSQQPPATSVRVVAGAHRPEAEPAGGNVEVAADRSVA
jgi:hypothetical protein